MSEHVRVRFAPSPTGHLHVGGARTAIYNWAFARSHKGTFILRIDDTDSERSTDENVHAILSSLRWLGLDWDEGPEVGGDYGPYFQTQRASSYSAALLSLRSAGALYPCFCSAEELAAKRDAARSAGGFSGYDRTCRTIQTLATEKLIASGSAHVWRLKVPSDRGEITFTDGVRGASSFSADAMDDFIVARSDGSPTYNFATVIDDVEMEITHVIRGDDHLPNTPRQILVFEALGAPVPAFAHLSMIRGADGKRLSKRHGAASVEDYRDDGYLPEALLNYLALLGWSLDDRTTIIDANTLATDFSLGRVAKNPAIFDVEKLEWMNSVYIRGLSADDFADRMTPLLVEAGLLTSEEADARRGWLIELTPLVAERIKRMDEIVPLVHFMFTDDIAFDEAAFEKFIRATGSRDVLGAVADSLASVDPFDSDGVEAALRAVPERLSAKPKTVFQVVRVALSGRTVSPPLFESIALLGRERTIQRLLAAAELTK